MTLIMTIFDIPEINLQIAKHLPPADLASACRVCRSWFVPFASQLWRSIQPDQWTHGALTDALPRYSVFVRQLRCSLFVNLDTLGPECTRLTLFKAPRLNHSAFPVLKRILESNPDIEELTLISDFGMSAIQLTMETIRIVAGLAKMRKLVLMDFVAPRGALEYMMEKLPRLEALSIEGWEDLPPLSQEVDPATGAVVLSGAMEEEVSDMTEQFGRDSEQQHQQQGQRQLRYLSMDEFQDGYESVLRIVRHTPLLEHLSLTQTRASAIDLTISPQLVQLCQQLRSHCPRLDQLSLNYISVDIGGLEYLLMAFPRMRKLAVNNVYLPQLALLSMLLNQDALQESLEDIRIADIGAIVDTLASSMLLALLRKFKKLKRVSLPFHIIEAEDMIRSDGEFKEELTCRNLEVLEVSIIGPNKSWAPPEAHAEGDLDTDDEDENQEEQPREYELYDAVMKRLDALPKLDKNTIRFRYKTF
ncbi:hypothetical protein BC939DRAFT_447183 [Gamsiella multidivaricata]|uniref:uncharacterized protein n=1 Tax=Gamsiella multidivaricata TaxID=101098 RepID=UPI002220F5A8|nr:uncharacterized protein BC939DRAFT_447183 [Gamsiella multidivaricata]KAG0366250.1 hypothetical protein BGZ54_005621 [Gamsiella multidivaricata]KAI7826188.1 hypothetical protein BC939DRAFT_447183 [Gamsiella multidivaricata]